MSDRRIRFTYKSDLQLSRPERTVAAASLCARLNGLTGDALGAPVRRWINRVVMDTRGAVAPLELLRRVNDTTRAGFRLLALRRFRAGRQDDPLAVSFIRTFPLEIEAEALAVELGPPPRPAEAPEPCDTDDDDAPDAEADPTGDRGPDLELLDDALAELEGCEIGG